MNCPNCGAPLVEGASFCEKCGVRIVNTGDTKAGDPAVSPSSSPPAAESAAAAQKRQTDPAKVVGLIVGSLLVLIGLILLFTSGESIRSVTFGGDFYTYMYKGIEAIVELLSAVKVGIAWIVIAIGAAIDVFMLRRRH